MWCQEQVDTDSSTNRVLWANSSKLRLLKSIMMRVKSEGLCPYYSILAKFVFMFGPRGIGEDLAGPGY